MTAPKRRKVSVHVLSRKMDPCECRVHRDFMYVWGWVKLVHYFVWSGPKVGELHSQKLSPAPSLPQVTSTLVLKIPLSQLAFLFQMSPKRKHFCFLQPTLVQDMTGFKRSLPLFPPTKPHINFMAVKLWSIPRRDDLTESAWVCVWQVNEEMADTHSRAVTIKSVFWNMITV